MALNDVYKEVESDKKNKVSDPNSYSMPLEEFIDEHKRLIKILKEGSREELLAEAKKQEDELEECMEEHGMMDENEGSEGED